MKLWLSRSSDVSIQEQLSTQLILGIVSGDLAPGERLPSTSEVARRFQVHANTVRAAYRGLAKREWIEWRHGSGFYVRSLDEPKPDSETGLDHLVSGFLKVARDRGHKLSDIRTSISRWLSLQAPDHVLVIEPDADLRAILIAEIKAAIPFRVEGIGDLGASMPQVLTGALCTALASRSEQLRPLLPAETPFVSLHSSSIPGLLVGERRPTPDQVITIISCWPDFLQRARATLVAVGIDPGSLDLRDARQAGWDRGLGPTHFIIADSLIARRVPKGCRPRIVPILNAESIEELKAVLQVI